MCIFLVLAFHSGIYNIVLSFRAVFVLQLYKVYVTVSSDYCDTSVLYLMCLYNFSDL